MDKNVLVIGGGGREHALCWKLAQSPQVQNVYCAPGNVLIATTEKVKCIELDIKNYPALAQWCKEKNIDLVVVGPEDPLADGIVDEMATLGIKCFGPTRAGARIEADKDWAKIFMVKNQIPTARYKTFTDAKSAIEFINKCTWSGIVVKASGLAAGKGVVVAESREEACTAAEEMLDGRFGSAGLKIVLEEKLEGEEVSVLAFCDGRTVRAMPSARDHKRALEGDRGPNTGGMGACCPSTLLSPPQRADVIDQILQRAVDALAADGIPYVGVLYAGLMVTKAGPMTLEFNCRFGDPETQVLMPLLESDLYEVMKACVDGRLDRQPVTWDSRSAVVGVVLAARGYPGAVESGCVVSGVARVAATENVWVWGAGVARGANGAIVTRGGRVACVTARAPSLRAAAVAATSAAAAVDFPGKQYRRDIAHKELAKSNGLSYLEAGVDSEAAAELLRRIEPLARATHRKGVVAGLGPFPGLFRLPNDPEVTDPVLILGTDGVGTKLKIAEELNKFDTIGQDLVAMCVNDIVCAGAEPFAFLDYVACGRLRLDVAADIIGGVARACTESGCALLGGETAEMPGVYAAEAHDLAGVAAGVVQRGRELPRPDDMKAGDVLLALPSTGLHSNGFSLLHLIMKHNNRSYDDKAEFSTTGSTLGEEFLRPTALYPKVVLPAIRAQLLLATAHVTGGGLKDNVPRVLPTHLTAHFQAKDLIIPPLFGWLQAKGGLTEAEMLRTFNLGVGMVLIVPSGREAEVLSLVPGSYLAGKLISRPEGTDQVIVEGLTSVLEPLAAPYRQGPKTSLSYKSSGVDIDAGESLVSLIKPLAKSTVRPGAIGGLGGFGGCFQLSALEEKYDDPVLAMTAAGVGTKLLAAASAGGEIGAAAGRDAAALACNELLVRGARPLALLDYYACGKLDVGAASAVLGRLAEGCRAAGAALVGGETAEMPGIYDNGIFDLAAFAVGIVDRSKILPRIEDIAVGDIVVGLPSSGVHSNGFSMVHRLLQREGLSLSDKAPFSPSRLTIGEELLEPTKIYVKSVLPVLERGLVKAVCVAADGGLWSLARFLPTAVRARLNALWWDVPPVFAWIAERGAVSEEEMLRTFNCGLGMLLVVAPERQAEVMNAVRGYGAVVAGSLQARCTTGPAVIVDNLTAAMHFSTRLHPAPTKRVAVLASGNGSNLQALAESCRHYSQRSCADVVLVVSDKKDAYALQRAASLNIAVKVLVPKEYNSREEFDLALSDELEKNQIDIVCLAGFMRILSPTFVRKWRGRVLNVHPSLLPLHTGMHAVRKALAAGDTYTGCTVHFVDEGMDTGPVLVQERIHILPEDTEETLSERVHCAEHRAFPRALRLLASGRARLDSRGKLLWCA